MNKLNSLVVIRNRTHAHALVTHQFTKEFITWFVIMMWVLSEMCHLFVSVSLRRPCESPRIINGLFGV